MTAYLGSALALSAFYGVVFFAERCERFRFRVLPYRRRFLGTDLVWYLIVVGMSGVSVLLVQPFLEQIAVEPIAGLVRGLPAAGRFLLALLLFDVVSYAVHRGLHRSELLWNIHKVHHSSLELDALATTRQHLMENAVRFIPGQVIMFLIGIPPAQVAPAVAVGAAWAVVDHSNLDLDLRMLERWVVTPRLHRRHHVPSTTNCNFGGVSSIWDRMFGTFLSIDTADDERFGCPGEVDTYPQRFADAVRRPPRDIAARLSARGSGHDRTVVGTGRR